MSVEYGLCTDIATGCGFQTKDLEQALLEDNLQRQDHMQLTHYEESGMHMEEGEASGQIQEGPDLEFDSGEDLESDEEMI